MAVESRIMEEHGWGRFDRLRRLFNLRANNDQASRKEVLTELPPEPLILKFHKGQKPKLQRKF